MNYVRLFLLMKSVTFLPQKSSRIQSNNQIASTAELYKCFEKQVLTEIVI